MLGNNTHQAFDYFVNSTSDSRVIRSTRGVLPVGPTGVLAPDSPPLSYARRSAGTNLIQYTFDLQGLVTRSQCEYTNSSPIILHSGAYNLDHIHGSCPLGQDVFPQDTWFPSISSDYKLGYWACGQGERDTHGSFKTYQLYFRGYQSYEGVIGNITCTLSPVHPAIFPVTYSGRTHLSSIARPIQSSAYSTGDMIEQSTMAVGSLVVQGQEISGNAIAESVISVGVKSLGLSPYLPDPRYLRIFEAMLQGVIEYEVGVPNPLFALSAI